jgi:hypothetical protein
MDGDQRKVGNEDVTENVERPARGPRRRTRDSGALPDLDDLRKTRDGETTRDEADLRRSASR